MEGSNEKRKNALLFLVVVFCIACAISISYSINILLYNPNGVIKFIKLFVLLVVIIAFILLAHKLLQDFKEENSK